jgi:hypothetical protein
MDAFDALVELLSFVGHLEPRTALGDTPVVRGSRVVGLRQLDAQLVAAVEDSLAGRSRAGIETLSRALLEKPRARREAAHVEELVRIVDDFYRVDLAKLHDVMRRTGREGTFVPQAERDALFIEAGARP